jgi:hypothetical protein
MRLEHLDRWAEFFGPRLAVLLDRLDAAVEPEFRVYSRQRP